MASMPRMLPGILAGPACLLAAALLAASPAGLAPSMPAGREVPTPIDPPNISVTLPDATLEQISETLTHTMGVPIRVWPGGRANEKFTLALQDKPFWDVFSAISAQHPIVPRNSNGFSLAAQGWGVQRYVVSRGFVFYVDGLNRRHNINLQAPAGQQVEPEKLTLSLTFAADPRVVVLQHAPPHFTQILDDAPNGGHNLQQQQSPDKLVDDDPTRAQIWGVNLDLDAPKNLGQNILSAKAAARFLVQSAELRQEVPNPDQRLNEKIPLGLPNSSVTFTAFRATPSEVQFTAALALPPDPARPAHAVRLSITDAAGQRIWSSPLTTASRTYSAKGPFNLPLKAVIAVTSQSQLLTVPVELQDIPLPR
jgi:hypothetical protein